MAPLRASVAGCCSAPDAGHGATPKEQPLDLVGGNQLREVRDQRQGMEGARVLVTWPSRRSATREQLAGAWRKQEHDQRGVEIQDSFSQSGGAVFPGRVEGRREERNWGAYPGLCSPRA